MGKVKVFTLALMPIPITPYPHGEGWGINQAVDPLNHILRKPDQKTALECAKARLEQARQEKADRMRVGHCPYTEMLILEVRIEREEELVRRLEGRERRSA